MNPKVPFTEPLTITLALADIDIVPIFLASLMLMLLLRDQCKWTLRSHLFPDNSLKHRRVFVLAFTFIQHKQALQDSSH